MSNHGAKHEREFLSAIERELAAAGIHERRVERTAKGHQRIHFTVRGQPRFVICSSSRDWRAVKNARSNVRRLLEASA